MEIFLKMTIQMLLLFAATASAIFVPFSTTQFTTVPTMSKAELEKIELGKNYTIAIGLPDDAAKSEQLERTFLNAAIHFHGRGHFAIIDKESAQEVAKDAGVSLPCIVVYFNGLLMGSYLYPDDEGTMLYQIEGILENLPEPAKTMNELLVMVGPSPFVLFCPPNMTKQATLLQYRAGSQMGPVQVVPVEPEVLMSLGVNPQSMSLFRKEDGNVVEVDFDLGKLFEASYPVYRILMASDLRDPNALVAALVSSELTEEYRDFLFELGSRFPTFVVGWVGDDLMAYVEQVTHEEYTGSPLFVVFNADAGQHWNPGEWFTPQFLQQDFNVDAWVNAASRMLKKIESGELKEEYLSEEVPPETNDVCQKVVGTTYKDFVMDETKDVVMLYKRQNCPHCDKFFPEYKYFAEECQKAGLDFLKFGYIDVSRNSADIRYPYMPGVPHLFIFPAKNKTGGDALRGGRDRDGMIRWLKRYASKEIPFEAAPLDKAKVAMELFQLLFTAKDMPAEEQAKAMAYIQEQSEFLGLNNKTEEATPKEGAKDEL